MIELYRYFNGLSNSITKKIFSKRNIEYNFRNYRVLTSSEKLTCRYGLKAEIIKLHKLEEVLILKIFEYF